MQLKRTKEKEICDQVFKEKIQKLHKFFAMERKMNKNRRHSTSWRQTAERSGRNAHELWAIQVRDNGRYREDV